jgi:hypothetical protein
MAPVGVDFCAVPEVSAEALPDAALELDDALLEPDAELDDVEVGAFGSTTISRRSKVIWEVLPNLISA